MMAVYRVGVLHVAAHGCAGEGGRYEHREQGHQQQDEHRLTHTQHVQHPATWGYSTHPLI
jgi:hypothetical protein